jgi:hypothetical protein
VTSDIPRGRTITLTIKRKSPMKQVDFKSCTRAGGGTRDHSYERIKGHIPSLDAMEASGPKIKRRYQPQQENLVVLVTFATSG